MNNAKQCRNQAVLQNGRFTGAGFFRGLLSAMTAAVFLVTLLLPAHLSAGDVSEPPTGGVCTGTVTDNAGKAIAGVPVSDGVQIVRTGEDGKYTLNVAPCVRPIVYISVPDGYKLQPDAFWRAVKFKADQAGADFKLSPRKSVKNFVFIQITDSHHVAGTHSAQDVASFIKAANAMEPSPEFVVDTGDLAMGVDGDPKVSGVLDNCLAQYDGFVDVFKPLDCPLLKTIGNHDCAISLPEKLPEHHKGLYRRYFGPMNYSFDYGDIHFIALDADTDGPVEPGKWQDGKYDVFDEKALAWLAKDLALLPKGKAIVLFIHQPPYGVRNFDRLVEMLKPYNLRSAFSGHWHRNNTLDERQRGESGPFIVTGALFGGWGGKPCTDGAWRGYRFVAVDGKDVRSCYAAIDKPFQAPILNINVLRRAQNPLEGKVEVIMDILDVEGKLSGVGCEIYGAPAVEMKSEKQTDLWSRWSAVIDTAGVPSGNARLVFTPRTADNKWRYEFPVVVKAAAETPSAE